MNDRATQSRTFLLEAYSIDGRIADVVEIESALNSLRASVGISAIFKAHPYIVPAAGKVAFEFHLGQRVCKRSDGKIGRVHSIQFDSEGQMTLYCLLEEPYVHPAWKSDSGHEYSETQTWRQSWLAWECQPIGDAGRIDEAQRKLAEACAPWFARVEGAS